MIAVFAAFVAVSCSTKDDMGSDVFEVNYINVAGTWQLSTGGNITKGTEPYVYLVLNRKPDEDRDNLRTWESWDNLGSSFSKHTEGIYSIVSDEDYTPIIKGYYDHGIGINLWGHEYYVTELSSDRMVWTAVDDKDIVSVFVRCDSVPEDIVAGTKSL